MNFCETPPRKLLAQLPVDLAHNLSRDMRARGVLSKVIARGDGYIYIWRVTFLFGRITFHACHTRVSSAQSLSFLRPNQNNAITIIIDLVISSLYNLLPPWLCAIGDIEPFHLSQGGINSCRQQSACDREFYFYCSYGWGVCHAHWLSQNARTDNKYKIEMRQGPTEFIFQKCKN